MFCSLKIKAFYRAGEISYRWIYGYTYEIKYKTYTNVYMPDNYCSVSSAPCEGIITRTNGICNGFCAPYCDGVVLSPDVKENEYIVRKTYPGPGTYKLCLTPGSRGAGIVNIPNSVNQLFSIESVLNISSFLGPNTSALFFYPPVGQGCVGSSCVVYNAGGTDPDGDSLSYAYMPYTQVLGASAPSGSFNVNAVTGIVTWCGSFYDGEYNFVVRVTEWRKTGAGNYSMAGYTDRDIQISMSVCTGVEDLAGKAPQVALYPNPFHDVLNLSLQNNTGTFSVVLYDIAGRKLNTFLNDEPIGQTTSLELGGFGPGIYLLKISSSAGTVTKKIIKH